MGYKIIDSIDKVNEYIHSYGLKIPDAHKYIAFKNKFYVYDKNDVLDNWRCYYYPYTNTYKTCKTVFDYKLACDALYDKYADNSGMQDFAEYNAWLNASSEYRMLKEQNKPIIGSIILETLDPANRNDISEIFTKYNKVIDPENLNTETSDIRIFAGKMKKFNSSMQRVLTSVGFNIIENQRGVSFQKRDCTKDEINHWISCCKKVGFVFKYSDSKFNRSDDYRDIFFDNTKPVLNPTFICNYCGKIRPQSLMTPVDIIPQTRLEKEFEIRKLAFASDFTHNMNIRNKAYACKKCAALKGNAIQPWDFFYEQTLDGGWFFKLRYYYRVIIKPVIIIVIIMGLFALLSELLYG